MARPTVVWTQTAIKQRRAVFRYWTERNGSPEYAKKLLKQIKSRINLIVNHPEACIPTDFPNTRMTTMGHFGLFYRHVDNQIIIMAFWDNRQDPKKLRALLDN
ncbi:type II toxin-antitoxin system RelE/ParE family toxin [Olivibacter sitiensis]|uniref:type II toxin-antitoxin system RelE/ParE family toxin n=1 Tax=Olivibacter sitiensis TaxID=376470 RepID=UPI00048316EC